MYQKYHTDSLVLRSYDRGEADRVFMLYTREFGLVWARASSVRREESRMRYSLQNHALSRISLIRGARGWRIAGTLPGHSLAGATREASAVFARVASLIERLVKGEERNEYLFGTLTEAHAVLRESSNTALPAIELLCVARVLYALGYVSSEALSTALFTHTAFQVAHLEEAEVSRSVLLSSVNKALAETHL